MAARLLPEPVIKYSRPKTYVWRVDIWRPVYSGSFSHNSQRYVKIIADDQKEANEFAQTLLQDGSNINAGGILLTTGSEFIYRIDKLGRYTITEMPGYSEREDL